MRLTQSNFFKSLSTREDIGCVPIDELCSGLVNSTTDRDQFDSNKSVVHWENQLERIKQIVTPFLSVNKLNSNITLTFTSHSFHS